MSLRISHDVHTGVVNDWTANQIFSGKIYLEDAGGEHLEGNGSLLTITGATKFANPVYINETANAGVTMGLTINQGSNTDAILELKATGVNHDRVGLAEDDTFAQFRQTSGNYGGLTIRSLAEGGPSAPNDIVTQIYSSGGKAATGKNTGGYGLVDIYVEQTQDNSDGTWVTEDITSNGNIFSIRARVGDANVARWILDEDGDQFVVSVTTSGDSAAATAFDAYEDAELIRAYETARTPSELIRSEWDDNVRYNQKHLIDLGILGDTLERGGMTNQSQLIRLHNGAIWQGHVRQKQLEQKVESLEGKLALLEGAKE